MSSVQFKCYRINRWIKKERKERGKKRNNKRKNDIKNLYDPLSVEYEICQIDRHKNRSSRTKKKHSRITTFKSFLLNALYSPLRLKSFTMKHCFRTRAHTRAKHRSPGNASDSPSFMPKHPHFLLHLDLSYTSSSLPTPPHPPTIQPPFVARSLSFPLSLSLSLSPPGTNKNCCPESTDSLPVTLLPALRAPSRPVTPLPPPFIHTSRPNEISTPLH